MYVNSESVKKNDIFSLVLILFKKFISAEQFELSFLSSIVSGELRESYNVDSKNTNRLDPQPIFYHIFYFKFEISIDYNKTG